MNVCGKTLLILAELTLVSCIEKESSSSRTTSGGVSNNSETVSVGYGRILSDNPIILSGNTSFSAGTGLATLLSAGQDFITSNSFLSESCTMSGYSVSSCFQVKQDSLTNQFQSTDGKWGYEAGTSEFLQVNNFAHIKKQTTKYLSHLSSASANYITFG